MLNAELRHRRALEHLNHIEILLSRIERERKFVVGEDRSKPGQEILHPPPAAAGEDLRVRIGEQVFNLRATLDYIVFVLSGQRRTAQFPLDDNPTVFETRKTGSKHIRGYLIGVSAAHCDLIERYQPYPGNGCEWAALLGRLSNRDKHRELIPVEVSSGRALTRTEFPGIYANLTLYPGEQTVPGYEHVEVEVEFPVSVALPDGTPVREGTRELQAKVGEVLALFQRELRGGVVVGAPDDL